MANYRISQIPNTRTYFKTADVLELDNPSISPSSDQQGQISAGALPTVNLAVTGLTGGGTNLDNIPTVNRINPSILGIVVNGRLSWWVLQTSSATPGPGVVQPIDNSALRWIQVL
jgi:hypothetical protein